MFVYTFVLPVASVASVASVAVKAKIACFYKEIKANCYTSYASYACYRGNNYTYKLSCYKLFESYKAKSEHKRAFGRKTEI